MREEERTERRDELAELAQERSFRHTVERGADRKVQARLRHDSIWSWLGTFGMVGWSVMVPTLLGVALGIWLDGRWDTGVTFTVAFVILGVAAGALMAWYWVRRESTRTD